MDHSSGLVFRPPSGDSDRPTCGLFLLRRSQSSVSLGWTTRSAHPNSGASDTNLPTRHKKIPSESFLARRRLFQAIDRLPPPARWGIKRLIYYPFSHPIRRPVLSDNLRAALVGRLRDDTTHLREFTGRRFEGWSL